MTRANIGQTLVHRTPASAQVKRRKRWVSFGRGLLISGWAITAVVGAGRIAPAAAPPILRVLEDTGTKNKRSDQGFFHFGQDKAKNRPQVVQVFHLKNETSLPLVLNRLEVGAAGFSSLGITANVTPELPGGGLPTLAPNDKVSIRVAVDLTKLGPGTLLKAVKIYAVGSAMPVAHLYITGTILP